MSRALFVGYVDLAFDFVGTTSDLCRFSFDGLLLLLRVHRPLQGDNAVLGDHFDVVGRGGEGLILDQGATHLLGERPQEELLLPGRLALRSRWFIFVLSAGVWLPVAG